MFQRLSEDRCERHVLRRYVEEYRGAGTDGGSGCLRATRADCNRPGDVHRDSATTHQTSYGGGPNDPEGPTPTLRHG